MALGEVQNSPIPEILKLDLSEFLTHNLNEQNNYVLNAQDHDATN